MIRGWLWNWLPWVYNKAETSIDVVRRIFKVSYNEISSKNQWYILKDMKVPVYSSFFPNTPDSIIVWSCTTGPPRCIAPGHSESKYKHISYLGCTLYIPGCDPVDITDWINTVEWSGINEPSLTDLFQLWCCDTGNSYFHLMSEIKVTLITEMGDEITKGLNDSPTSIPSTNDHAGNSQAYIDRHNTDRPLDLILSSSGC